MEVRVGAVFEYLTVLTEPYKIGKFKYVDCRCVCGKVITITPRRLTTHRSHKRESCGCMKKRPREVILGELFGRLKVVGLPKKGDRRKKVSCLCSCGTKTSVRFDALIGGKTLSCGCYQKDRVSEVTTKHGMTKSRTHDSWTSMKQRCTNENTGYWEDYGGRGITYDPRWELFENFLEDMGECPDDMRSLDRIDVNGNYCKDNCRWTDDSIQIHNQRKRRTNGKYSVTSVFHGVSYEKSRNKWTCRLQKNGKKVFFKRYSTELEAAKAYDEQSLKYYGDEPNKELIKEYIENGKC